MNGAESLVRTLVAGGVNLCFANPGTSEMHFVAALDTVPGMRCVLGLFEGVVTGAADGYYRMKGDVAATLLHLGPGLGNGLANLHNAKKARSGIVNLVGEHATYHLRHDAPLTSDIVGVATPMSDWVHTAASAETLAADAALAVRAARTAPGGIATLIAPADTAWGEAAGPVVIPAAPPRPRVSDDAVRDAARALTRDGAMLMLGGAALRGRALELAGRIAAKTGCRLMAEYNNARMEAGAGRPPVPRLPYVIANALAATAGVRELVLCGARSPVAFFAYPGQPSVLIGDDCTVRTLAQVADDLEHALDALAAELDALHVAPLASERIRPPLNDGVLNADTLAAVLAALLPEHAVVCDESVSTGRQFGNAMRHAAPHDWLSIMGGSIGWALPAAVGAAIAAPERKVVALESDGSGMYTLQALWTMAREELDVTVVVFANRAYQILRGEFANVGAGAPGRNATDMLMLDRPDLDWCALARGMGVPAEAADTAVTFAAALGRAFAERGPRLIVARM